MGPSDAEITGKEKLQNCYWLTYAFIMVGSAGELKEPGHHVHCPRPLCISLGGKSCRALNIIVIINCM